MSKNTPPAVVPRAAESAKPDAASTVAPQGRREQLLVAGLLLAFAVGGFAMWQHTHGFITSQEDYQLDLDEVEITPLPHWIREDIRDEALGRAGFDQKVSILDGSLPKRVEEAFAAHPWVERVTRVAVRHPAGVDVDMIYRRPVCMVELPTGYTGVYPVDAHGVVLPTKDFTASQAQNYPRLSNVAKLPAGKVGTAWGDPCVLEGACLAAELAEQWKSLRLQAINVVDAGSPTGGATFELATQDHVRILWGHAPCAATRGEPTVQQKLDTLQTALATAKPGSAIDVRGAAAKEAQTARRDDDAEQR